MPAPTSPSVVDSLEALAGGTPVVRLQRLAPTGGATVHLKLGGLSPTGSEKDAAAVAWMRDAEARGAVPPGGHLVVPTTGNLGISLAWLCAARGLKMTVVMPDTASLERRALVTAYGAALVTVPVEEGFGAVRARAAAEAKRLGSAALLVDPFTDDRFESIAARGLAADLVATIQADGGRIDACVLGVGSGATLVGVAPVLRAAFPGVKVVAVEPERAEGPHRQQGLVPQERAPRLARVQPDAVERVSDAEARTLQRRLGREEGILAGISTGAVLVGALRTAAGLASGARVYALGTDSGERDFSLEEWFA